MKRARCWSNKSESSRDQYKISGPNSDRAQARFLRRSEQDLFGVRRLDAAFGSRGLTRHAGPIRKGQAEFIISGLERLERRSERVRALPVISAGRRSANARDLKPLVHIARFDTGLNT
jgi:hypothetical protein